MMPKSKEPTAADVMGQTVASNTVVTAQNLDLPAEQLPEAITEGVLTALMVLAPPGREQWLIAQLLRGIRLRTPFHVQQKARTVDNFRKREARRT